MCSGSDFMMQRRLSCDKRPQQIVRNGAVGEEMAQEGGFKLAGGGDDRFCPLAGALDGAEDPGDGALLGEWRKRDEERKHVTSRYALDGRAALVVVEPAAHRRRLEQQ